MIEKLVPTYLVINLGVHFGQSDQLLVQVALFFVQFDGLGPIVEGASNEDLGRGMVPVDREKLAKLKTSDHQSPEG